jgi:hypothetical protein
VVLSWESVPAEVGLLEMLLPEELPEPLERPALEPEFGLVCELLPLEVRLVSLLEPLALDPEEPCAPDDFKLPELLDDDPLGS